MHINFLDMEKQIAAQWRAIAMYAFEHCYCLHQCLPEIRPVGQLVEDDDDDQDDYTCYFRGKGIFCYAWGDYSENDVCEKQLVPLIEHIECEDCKEINHVDKNLKHTHHDVKTEDSIPDDNDMWGEDITLENIMEIDELMKQSPV